MMSTPQQYFIVLFSLGRVSLNTPYKVSQLYAIYQTCRPDVDQIFLAPPQLNQVLTENSIVLPQVIILDPDAIWGV